MLKERYGKGDSDYKRERKVDVVVETVFRLYAALYEPGEAIKYFKKNCPEKDKEIKLFILLELLFEYDLKEHWVSEYNEAVDKGVEPREELQITYRYICKNGEFPEYITGVLW